MRTEFRALLIEKSGAKVQKTWNRKKVGIILNANLNKGDIRPDFRHRDALLPYKEFCSGIGRPPRDTECGVLRYMAFYFQPVNLMCLKDGFFNTI